MDLDEFLKSRLAGVAGGAENLQYTEISVDADMPFNPYAEMTCPVCNGLLVPDMTQLDVFEGGIWPERAICQGCSAPVMFVVVEVIYPVFKVKEEVSRGKNRFTAVPIGESQTDVYIYQFVQDERKEGSE